MATRRRARCRDDRPARRADPARHHDGRARPDRRGLHPRARRRSDVEGLPRLSRGDLHLAEHDGGARHPGSHRVEEGDLLSVDVGITLDGLVADSAYTFAIGEVDPEAQRLLEVGQQALGRRHRPGPLGQPGRGHLPRRPAGRRGRGLLRRPLTRRPRRRPLLPRGAADPELRRAGQGPAPPVRDDAGDRADDHGRRPRGVPPRRRVVDLDRGRLLAVHFEHTVAVAEEGPPRVLTAAKSRERAGLVP